MPSATCTQRGAATWCLSKRPQMSTPDATMRLCLDRGDRHLRGVQSCRPSFPKFSAHRQATTTEKKLGFSKMWSMRPCWGPSHWTVWLPLVEHQLQSCEDQCLHTLVLAVRRVGLQLVAASIPNHGPGQGATFWNPSAWLLSEGCGQ
jgi:hypothetical protein